MSTPQEMSTPTQVMPSPADVIAAYVAAWAERDEAARRRLLERAWADDGTYTDPLAHVLGREALVQHIGLFQQQAPMVRLVRASGIDEHHGVLRFAWKAEGATEPPLAGLEGLDIGELAGDGRLRRIIGFFGPLPSLDQAQAGDDAAPPRGHRPGALTAEPEYRPGHSG